MARRARRGLAGLGKVGQCKAGGARIGRAIREMVWRGGRGAAWQCVARQGGHGWAGRGLAGLGKAGGAGRGAGWRGLDWQGGRGEDWLFSAWRGPAWRAWRGRARQGPARRGADWRGKQWKGRQMKPDEVKALREESDLSVAESARCVQISGRSWQRYESGERKVPEGIVELFCIKNGLKYPRD